MPNPAALTVTNLAANGAVNQPAVNTIDTTGTVPAAVEGETERVILEIINAAAVVLTVKIKAGAEGAGAGRGTVGDLSVTLAATGTATDKRIIGPLESARFVQADGKLNVEFTPASGSPNATVRLYRLPRAV